LLGNANQQVEDQQQQQPPVSPGKTQ
jgi:hypothetical protein